MDSVSKKQSSGVALVFVLMGLIALLALAVVFLSRLGRETPAGDSAPAGVETVTTGTEEQGPAMIPGEEPETTATVEDQEAQSPEQVIVPPPPPPPVNTPDTRNLPPEG